MADDNLKLYLSQLEIDGKLYDLKDAEARTAIQNLTKTIEDNEEVTAAALNDLKSTKADKTEIPTKVSDLDNDTPFATKEQLDALAETVSGLDTETVEQLQKIIDELENSENGNAWITAIDKLAGLGNNSEAVYYTQEEIDAAQEGDPAYGKTTSDIKTPADPKTVKQYVDAAVAALEAADTALNNAKVNKADIEEVTITQNTFTIVEGEKLTIGTNNLNVLKNKVAAGS